MIDWQVINPNITPLNKAAADTMSDNINGAHSFLIEYYKACRNGIKIIGRELMTTLEMLIQELAAPEFRMNIAAAHKRIEFIESKIKHFESPFAGEPFILTLEQKAIAETLFAFEYYDPEYNKWVRRFNEVLLLIARKNGKTPFTGALTIADWFCGQMGQKVMCASNDYEQAGLIFDCINNFRDQSAALRNCTRKNNFGIFWGNPKQRKKIGKFTEQNKGTIKKMTAKSKAKEGRNLKIVILDEVHEMVDRSTVLPLRSSLTTQLEPLYFEITTEGIVNDGYLDERLVEARKYLRGELDVPRPRWLVWLYTQDSEFEVWNDESSWVKSNPLLGVIKRKSELRYLVDKARTNGAERAFTLAKEFNIKSSRPSAWLEDKVITNELPIFSLEDFRGCYYVGGADLSETNDLSAVSMIFMRPNDHTKYVYTMYFVPRTKAVDINTTVSPTNAEKKSYLDWADGGYCRIIESDFIPDDTVANFLVECYEKYGVRPMRCGYDEWHAKEFQKILKKWGENVPVSINMTPAALDYGTRQVENDLHDNRLNYGQNPICIWNFKNAALRYNSDGKCMPIKLPGSSGNKIDGTMAKIIAYTALRQIYATFVSKAA